MKITSYALLGTSLVTLFSLGACQSESQPKNQPKNQAEESVTQQAADKPKASKKGVVSKDAYPTKLLWGDTHLHSANSVDAFAFGARLLPSDAYKFVRGDAVTAPAGGTVKLRKPLDFLVVADHGEGLGITREIYNGNKALLADPKAKKWYDWMQSGQEGATRAAMDLIESHANNTLPKTMTNPAIVGPLMMSVWRKSNDTAEEYNNPGTFTALIGYEYSSLPGGNNLHRIVIFRDGKDKTSTLLPFSSTFSSDPEDLWKALARYEKNTGGQVLAIPHNSNLSNGLMFAKTDFSGKPIDAEYAKERARWEPVVEITQIKGDSESHPVLSPNDEFAGYGDSGWDLGNLSLQELTTPNMLPGSYVREALKTGLSIESQTGTNPFKLGFIGSTDAHTALATADEDNFMGKFTFMRPSADRMKKDVLNQHPDGAKRVGWQYLAGGYAGVWARDNTRAEIWDALKRKEVYGTTGPRMQVRVFGGGNFKPNDASSPSLVKTGYAKGVPMGADLNIKDGQTPGFLIAASRDPDGANLDRVQMIKGWLDAGGTTHEKIYDVVWAGERSIGANGKLPSIGSSVDIKSAKYENTIGSAELTTVWKDPDFDAAQSAFYYVRVLEIPTPRWPAYDAANFKTEPPKEALLVSQERAYTSPIWYTPK